MRLGRRVLVLVLCVLVLAGGGVVQAMQEQETAKPDVEAALAVKISPPLSTLLDMERLNFPVPPDTRIGQAIASIRKTRSIYTYVRAAHELSEAEMRSIEALGVALSARSSPIPHRGNSYGASIPLDKIYDVARLPFVGLIDLRWSPWTYWTLDDSVPEMRGDLGWLLKDGQGRPLTGRGIRIAAFDTGVDILHPDFYASSSGPTGDITVAYLSVTAIGNLWDYTDLDITITTLSDVLGDDMPATDVDGWVLIL